MPSDYVTGIAASPDVGHLATGHLTVTGTANVATGLAGVVISCLASLQAPVVGAGNGWVVGVAPTATPGQIAITVKDSAGTTSTAPVVVDWIASDAQ